LPIARAPPPSSFPRAAQPFLDAQGNAISLRAWPVGRKHTPRRGGRNIRQSYTPADQPTSRNSRPPNVLLRLSPKRAGFLYSQGFGNDRRDGPFELNTTEAQKMKTLSALSLLLVIASAGLAAPAFAGEEAATSATAVKEDTATDCSKQVWPHFTPTCLRNDQATVVRVVTANRR